MIEEFEHQVEFNGTTVQYRDENNIHVFWPDGEAIDLIAIETGKEASCDGCFWRESAEICKFYVNPDARRCYACFREDDKDVVWQEVVFLSNQSKLTGGLAPGKMYEVLIDDKWIQIPGDSIREYVPPVFMYRIALMVDDRREMIRLASPAHESFDPALAYGEDFIEWITDWTKGTK